MRTELKRRALKKLFTNKILTYVVADQRGHGKIVEVEMNVVGKKINYTYTDVKVRMYSLKYLSKPF